MRNTLIVLLLAAAPAFAEPVLFNLLTPRFIQGIVNQSFTNGDVVATCVVGAAEGDAYRIRVAYDAAHDDGTATSADRTFFRTVDEYGRACATIVLENAVFVVGTFRAEAHRMIEAGDPIAVVPLR